MRLLYVNLFSIARLSGVHNIVGVVHHSANAIKLSKTDRPISEKTIYSQQYIEGVISCSPFLPWYAVLIYTVQYCIGGYGGMWTEWLCNAQARFSCIFTVIRIQWTLRSARRARERTTRNVNGCAQYHSVLSSGFFLLEPHYPLFWRYPLDHSQSIQIVSCIHFAEIRLKSTRSVLKLRCAVDCFFSENWNCLQNNLLGT